MLDAWAAIRGDGDIGQRVAIADWACDWSGLGLAQKLALDGHHVRLYCGASVAGESLQGIVRDHWIGEVHRLGIEVITFARLYGASGDTVFFQHMINDEPILCEDVDTLVSCYAPRSAEVPQWLVEQFPQMQIVGDALTPRTVEEAILEGFQAVHVKPEPRAA